MTSIHAVVLSYWPNRRNNVWRIALDLLKGSVVPERITILDNNPHQEGWPRRVESEFNSGPYKETLATDTRIEVVISTANTWTRGKYVAALLHPAPYSLLMDDDTSVGTRTVERLLEWSAGRRGLVTGYWGVKLSPDNKFIAGASIIQPAHVASLSSPGGRDGVPCDGFHGRAMWMSYDAIVRMLAVEDFVRFDDQGNVRYDHEGDDILAGLANPPYTLSSPPDADGWQTLRHEGSYVIPMAGDECFVDLDQCGEALQFQEGYFDARDAFTQDAVSRIRERGIPRW